jgi:hypothetical protein
MTGRSSSDAEARWIGATVMWVRVAATQRVRGAVGQKRGNGEDLEVSSVWTLADG